MVINTILFSHWIFPFVWLSKEGSGKGLLSVSNLFLSTLPDSFLTGAKMAVEFASMRKVEKEYHLVCEIKSKIQNYWDYDSKDRKFKASTEMFFLVPKTSTHQILFLDTWLPSFEEETYEVVALIEYPIAKPSRLGVRMANKDCHEPHLIVMTPHIDDELRKYVDYVRNNLENVKYPEIKLTVMPASMEEEFDV